MSGRTPPSEVGAPIPHTSRSLAPAHPAASKTIRALTSPARLLLLICLSACLPHALPGEVPFSHGAWSVDEGLPQASVHAILQSRDGYLWFATEAGVARFDGAGFRVFRHQTEPAFLSDDVSAVAQETSPAASGALWFGTANGLLRLSGSGWRRFTEADGLPSSTILSLVATDRFLLVLTARGLVRWNGSAFEAVPIADSTVTSLGVAPGGSAWIFTNTDEIWRYRNGTAQLTTLPSHSGSSPVAEGAIQGLQPGPGGALWSRTARSVRGSGPGLQRDFEIGRDLPGGRTAALYVDRAGIVWIGTSHGLFFLRPEPGATLQAVDALRLDSILSLLEDAEGNLWIGTETSGIHALRPRKFRTELASVGEAVTAGTITPDGTLWFGTQDDGLRSVPPWHRRTTRPRHPPHQPHHPLSRA